MISPAMPQQPSGLSFGGGLSHLLAEKFGGDMPKPLQNLQHRIRQNHPKYPEITRQHTHALLSVAQETRHATRQGLQPISSEWILWHCH